MRARVIVRVSIAPVRMCIVRIDCEEVGRTHLGKPSDTDNVALNLKGLPHGVKDLSLVQGEPTGGGQRSLHV